jgi:hypothetical protein
VSIVHNFFIRFIFSILLLSAIANTAAGETESFPAGTLAIKLQKSRLYIGESTTVTVILLAETAIRNMTYPILNADGLTLAEFAQPKQRAIMRDGVSTDIYEFTTRFTPRSTGTISIGPARLSGEISAPSDGAGGFFGETAIKRVTFTSTPLELTVLHLPKTGRPDDFTGVTGHFALKVSAEPTALEAGEPLTLTIVISGRGNLEKALCPTIQPAGCKSYPPKPQSSASKLQCSQVIIPEKAGLLTIPPLRFSFFNSSTARYESSSSSPITLTVTEKKYLQAAITSNRVKPFPLEPAAIAVASDTRQVWWYLLFLLPTGILLLTRHSLKQNKRLSLPLEQAKSAADPSFASYMQSAEQALIQNNTELFYRSVFRALLLLKESTSNLETLGFDDLIACCDAVRYGRHSPARHEMVEILDRVRFLQK